MHITSLRAEDRTPENKVELSSYEATMERAIESLVKWELGFGGRVVKATSTLLTIQTPVFHKIDTTIYEGDEDEMKTLLAIAALWEEERGTVTAEELAEKVGKVAGGLPLAIVMGTPLVLADEVKKRILDKLKKVEAKE